jgi:putative membrane protein
LDYQVGKALERERGAKGSKMRDIPRSTDELAHDRTYMAWGRSVMALERTLMAWIRTSLSLIGFGFAIFKFLQIMQREGTAVRAPRNLGLFFILLGMGLLIIAIIQFQKAMAKVRQFSGKKPQFSLSLVGAIGVLTAGLITVLNLFFGFGGF